MARRYPVSNEFFFLLAAEVAILITIPYIDWVLVNEVILKSNAPLLPPVVASYAKAFEAIKWAVILPTVALVALYKRDILSVTVWTVSAYVPFATGTEDLVYYIIGQRALPNVWPWLDSAPGIGWTRLLTGTPDVVLSGVVMATIVGWAFLVGLWLLAKNKGPLGSLNSSA